MNNPASSDALLDRQRLKYVAENFADLQGLRTVVLGAWLALMSMVNLYEGNWLLRGSGLPLAVLIVALIVWALYIPGYYERRFGRVERQNPLKRCAGPFLAMAVVFAVLFAFNRRLHLMISDPTNQVDLWPLSFWIAWMCYELWHWKRADPSRICVLFCCMLAAAFIALSPIWHPEARQLMWWKGLNQGSLGIGLIAVGFYDHFTLVRMLPKRDAEDDNE